MKKIALLMISFAMVACGETASEAGHEAEEHAEEAAHEAAETAEETAEEAEETAEEAADEAEEAVEGEEGGGTLCERAKSCCEAMVESMPEGTPEASLEAARQACSQIDQVANAPAATQEQTCTTMLNSYRQQFEARNLEVPASCAAE